MASKASNPAPSQSFRQIQVDEITGRSADLGERICLVLDPDVSATSIIDKETIQAMQEELEKLKRRSRLDNYRSHLEAVGEWEGVCDTLMVMEAQLQEKRSEVDPDYDPNIPLRLPGEAAQASPSRPERSRTAPGTVHTLNGMRESESGPQRGTPSTREARDQVNRNPSASRPRLIENLPTSNCKTFDVILLPFKSDSRPDFSPSRLSLIQLTLRDFGLVFQVRLPREGSVKQCLERQVKEFCEGKSIFLRDAPNTEAPVWDVMFIKERRGQPSVFERKDLTANGFTASTLQKTPFSQVLNHLSEADTTDPNPALLIAPIYGEINGAINLPGSRISRMKHYCHTSRLRALMTGQSNRQQCVDRCRSEANSGASGSRLGTGRTLGQ
ncbi:hypothetical protein R3P38DRAFT_609049 [Favolaschia claudopus]|uniref:Uncharacterized protein n=1 Tax=Favolaschia claudopus TaxID=2862362 RepID=A0AAW0CA33_9AGAR